MATTLRKMDNTVEQEIGKFLDNHFYPKYTSNSIRFNDIEHQMDGIDIQFDYKNLVNILVDEKTAAHYINKGIPTFAFEVDFLLNNQQVIPGWFFDSAKKTEYYLLNWVWAKKDKYITAEDITMLDTILIKRSAIIEMLSGYDITSESIVTIAKQIRSNNTAGAFNKEASKPFYFYFTTHLSEKPLNIIIKKDKLIQLSVARFNIKP